VDRGADSPYAGNVYVCWARFTASGPNNGVFLARSSDGGQTFRSQKVSESVHGSQFCDIAVTRNGAVYVARRQFEFRADSGQMQGLRVPPGELAGPHHRRSNLGRRPGRGVRGVRRECARHADVDGYDVRHDQRGGRQSGLGLLRAYDDGRCFLVGTGADRRAGGRSPVLPRHRGGVRQIARRLAGQPLRRRERSGRP
jgi:hypothetical protein